MDQPEQSWPVPGWRVQIGAGRPDSRDDAGGRDAGWAASRARAAAAAGGRDLNEAPAFCTFLTDLVAG